MSRAQFAKPVANSIWLAAERVSTLCAGLLVGIVVARYLGPQEFGRLSYLLAFVGLFIPLATLGLGFVVTRALVESHLPEGRVLFTSFVLRLVGGVFALGLMLLVHRIVNSEGGHERLLLAALGLSAISLALLTYECWFQAHTQAKYSALARMAALLISSAIKLWLVANNMGFEALVMASALEFILVAGAIALAYKLCSPVGFSGGFQVSTARALLAKSKWLVLSGVMAAVYMKIDLIMLRELSSPEQVGIYAVASRLSEAWYFVPVAITTSFFPALMGAKRLSRHLYQASLQKLCDGLLVIAVVVAVLASMFSLPLITTLYGEDYAGAAIVLTLHVWGGLFISMRALLSKWLIVEELYRYSLLSHGLGALVNVLINLLLIPRLGATGAAVATVISYAVASYFFLFLNGTTRPFALIMTKALLLPMGGFVFRRRGGAKAVPVDGSDDWHD